MTDHTNPIAKAEMLIRKPVAEVFEAFVNPAITSRFWFTKGSDRLEGGKQVVWEWKMYNHSVKVDVKTIELNRRIVIDWSAYGKPTTVEWIFTPRTANQTFVSITESGFSASEDEIVKQALTSTEGFTIVLAGAKAVLEHDLDLNLIADRFPDAVQTEPER